MNNAYRWFLGYSLLDNIPHFATVSYAFCNRFPAELSEEIFTQIHNKALNNRMVDPSVIFIDGTQIKANANNKKRRKELVAQTAKIYDEQLRAEVNADREANGKKPFNDDDEPPKKTEKTVSTTDPNAGMFRKGEHKTEFAYEAHTACDSNGFVLDVQVTAGNVHDSVAFDAIFEKVTERFPEVGTIAADSAYKTPWITKRIIDDGRIPSIPYTRAGNINHGMFRPWEYKYDIVTDSYTCPMGETIRHTTTDRTGKKKYLSNRKNCSECPSRRVCNNNANNQKTIDRHIWQEYIEIANDIRKTDWGKVHICVALADDRTGVC